MQHRVGFEITKQRRIFIQTLLSFFRWVLRILVFQFKVIRAFFLDFFGQKSLLDP